MTATDAISTIRQAAGWIGLALVVVAAGKFFGFNIPIRGSVSDTCLLAIACLLAR